jgi:FtsZ-binding cell division protein ZapB
MVTLEQVRQLETKIGKAIEYVNRVNAEDKLLREENGLLRGKLESSLKRVDELEESVQRFKEDQGRIEEGIIAALNRLNQFEDAIGKSLTNVQALVASSSLDVPSVSIDKPTDGPMASSTLSEFSPEKSEVPSSLDASPVQSEPVSAVPGFLVFPRTQVRTLRRRMSRPEPPVPQTRVLPGPAS